jgi:hypothetical protein
MYGGSGNCGFPPYSHEAHVRTYYGSTRLYDCSPFGAGPSRGDENIPDRVEVGWDLAFSFIEEGQIANHSPRSVL